MVNVVCQVNICLTTMLSTVKYYGHYYSCSDFRHNFHLLNTMCNSVCSDLKITFVDVCIIMIKLAHKKQNSSIAKASGVVIAIKYSCSVSLT